MVTMSISLPDELRAFVDERVSSERYSSSSEYVCDLIRRDRVRVHLREAALEGMRSGESGDMDAAFFERLRSRAVR